MSKDIFLSVIIPCYNEEANLKRAVLKSVSDYLSQQDFSWEVIISDDGSSDNSKKIVEEQVKTLKGFRQLLNPHGGKPSALLYGLKAAQGKYVLFTDMDQSTPITELTKLLPFTKDYCAVIGSRGISRKNFPFYRKVGSAIFLGVRRAMILPEIKDTQCGFKLFERESLLVSFPKLEFFKVKQRTHGWKVTSYDVELLHILKKMGCKIKEVVVTWNDEDISQGKGGGLRRYVRESVEMFSQILRVKLNDLKGLY